VADGDLVAAVDGMTAALEAESLYRFYHAGDDETIALRGVSLTVGAGEVVAVTGPSGSGKSTLLQCLAGLDDSDGGTVRVAGDRLSRRPEHERARLRARSIGVLYQLGNLVEHLDLMANLALVQRLAGRRPGERTEPQALLDQVGLAARASHRPSELSGGELARAGLAVALANDPRVLLCDEPTGELDGVTAQRVLDLLRNRATRGTAVLVATHSLQVAEAADREIALLDGAVMQ
jgi:putative ABC transport system ATP-binding protein